MPWQVESLRSKGRKSKPTPWLTTHDPHAKGANTIGYTAWEGSLLQSYDITIVDPPPPPPFQKWPPAILFAVNRPVWDGSLRINPYLMKQI